MRDSTPTPSAPASRAVWPGVAAALLTALLYSRTVRPDFDFVNLDDPQYVTNNWIVRNPSWQSARLLFREVWRPSTVEGYYQPLTMASLMLDAWLGGAPHAAPAATVFHAVNLLLHALNVLLVFGILRRLGVAAWQAAALAAVFGCHPVQVESVAWISQRKTLLATLFACIAVYAYLRAFAGRWRAGRTFVACGAYALGLLAKPTILPLPLVFLVLDAWPLRRWSRGAVLEKLPLYALMGVAAYVSMSSQAQSAVLGRPDWQQALPLAGVMLRNVVSLVERIVLPTGLSPHHPSLGPEAIVGWRMIVDAAVVAGGAALAWAVRRRAPHVFLGAASFLLLVSPSLGLFAYSPGLVGDRFCYLPLAFVLAPLGIWLSRAAARWQAAVWAGVAVLAVASYSQMLVWRNGEELYRYVLQVYPHHTGAQSALAQWLLTHGRPEEAVPLLKQAIEVEPQSPDHRYYLANAYQNQGRLDLALPLYAEAARLRPKAHTLSALGAALARCGRFAEAATAYEQARALSPNAPDACIGLGFTYLELDRPAAARAVFQELLQWQPRNAIVHFGLACAWARMDVLPTARAHLARAVEIDPAMARRAGTEPSLLKLARLPEFAGLVTPPATEGDTPPIATITPAPSGDAR